MSQDPVHPATDSGLIHDLIAELGSASVILPSDAVSFQQAIDEGSWAQQNREIIPACIVRPRDAHELSRAVTILKKTYDEKKRQAEQQKLGVFAVRSGGANPGLGVATMHDGVVVDLGLIRDVTPSPDGSSVTVGTGAKWIDVYRTLDEKGLVVMGGRNGAPVGVGGLVLQGGISFYSPRHGFVCSNVSSYEVVLADGTITTCSSTQHPDLWRVLKGGGPNNFAIVTRFTLRAMPSAPLWVGQLFTPAIFQHTRARTSFHNYVADASHATFDENAAGPILSFTTVQALFGIQIMALHMVHTKINESDMNTKTKEWPAHWKNTKFASLWPLFRTSKVTSHTEAVQQLGASAPAGTRHVQGTTTVRNDLDTLHAAYEIYCRVTTELRRVKGLLFSYVHQAILPAWMNKGDPHVLAGLEGCEEPLVILSCSVTWREAKDDGVVRDAVKKMLEEIDEMAAARNTGHPYRFMNYCMEWQRPLDGCGEEVLDKLWETSRKYDPDGFFQRGCVGGFKLPPLPGDLDR